VSAVFHIASRFILRRQRSMLLSLSGVVLGVAFYVATQAQTRGFEKHYIDTTLGTSGAIVISDRFQQRYSNLLAPDAKTQVSFNRRQARKYYEGITDAARIMRVVREFSGVISCAPIVQGNSSARSSFKTEVVRLQGIDLDLHLQTTALRDQISQGNLNQFRIKPQGILLGSLLAGKLEVGVGDNVTLSDIDGKMRTYQVCGIFSTGINVVDESRVYVHLGEAQNLLHKPSAVSVIIVRLRDANRAPEFSEHLERLIGHRARSWQDRERGELQLFQMLRVSTAVTLSTMILLSGFLIYNAFSAMVLEKTREIAILRSMGYRRSDITWVFLWQGAIVAVTGALLGCMMGAVLTFGISRIPIKFYGFFRLDHFVVSWEVGYFFQGIGIAFLAVLIACYFPSRRAARLAPVAILRGAGQ
jgi:lipoprotein-releasing system permease protein